MIGVGWASYSKDEATYRCEESWAVCPAAPLLSLLYCTRSCRLVQVNCAPSKLFSRTLTRIVDLCFLSLAVLAITACSMDTQLSSKTVAFADTNICSIKPVRYAMTQVMGYMCTFQLKHLQSKYSIAFCTAMHFVGRRTNSSSYIYYDLTLVKIIVQLPSVGSIWSYRTTAVHLKCHAMSQPGVWRLHLSGISESAYMCVAFHEYTLAAHIVGSLDSIKFSAWQRELK